MKKITRLVFVISTLLFFLLSPSINTIGETPGNDDCCSDCCRWAHSTQDCRTYGLMSYCLDVKLPSAGFTFCEACIVVKPD